MKSLLNLSGIFCFGFAAGIPMGLCVPALNAWLAQIGLSNVTIGIFAILSFSPYTFKFLLAPFLDHFALPFLSNKFGKKRSWLFFIQVLLVFSITMLAGSNPESKLIWMAIWSVLVAFLAALHEIILDEYRILVLPEFQQGIGSSCMLFGSRLGFLFGSGFVLFAADYLCYSKDICQNSENWKLIYRFVAPFIFVGGVATIFLGEPKCNTYTVRSTELIMVKNLILQPLKEISKKKNYVLILLFVSCYRICDAFIAPMINPFLIDMQFSLVEIAIVEKTFGVGAMVFGIFIGGMLVHRLNIANALFIGGFLQTLSNFMFILQSKVVHSVPLLYLTIAAENACGSIANTAVVSYISRISKTCNSPGTVYAMLSSLVVINALFLPIVSGFVVDKFGWDMLFKASIALGAPSLLLLLVIVKNGKAEHLS